MILHPQLKKDCTIITQWELSIVLLMNDAHYPWFILVPQREKITEIYQLPSADQQQLMLESCRLAQVLMAYFKADKMNIATLGNIVPQLHVHHVVRFRNDATWPAPVWGALPALPYADDVLQQRLQQIREQLQ